MSESQRVVVILEQGNPSDYEPVTYAVYANGSGDILQMGGCARKDLSMQNQFFPDSSVMEVERTRHQRPAAYRIDLSGAAPRLVEV